MSITCNVQSFKAYNMRTRKSLPVLTFMSGMFAGALLLGILSFSSPNPPMDIITAADAHAYYLNYMGRALPYNNVIKGYVIDIEQYNAMGQIIKDNPQLAGFRIYNGIDNNSTNLGIVVGVTSQGLDYISGKIYKTVARSVGPCPPVCDNSSPIIHD
jgi:hypothetical protein